MEVEYDPAVVSYNQLLEAFWKLHNPSASFPRGSQYRSAIFYHTPEQAELARKSAAELTRKLGRTVNTEIVPASTFYKAEDYHQNYYQKQGLGFCHL